MKRLIYALIILLFITTVSILGGIMICQYCEKSKEELIFCASLCEEEKWQEAENQSSKIIYAWEKREKLMAVFIDHKLLDNITDSVSTLPVYAKTRNKNDYYAQCSKITTTLNRIKATQTISVENFY